MKKTDAGRKLRHRQGATADDAEASQGGGETSSSGRQGRRTFRCSGHFRSLLDGVLTLRQSGVLYDVVLLVEGRPIQAHRILLAASCHYFRGMFAGGLRESEQKEISIHGVSFTAMKKLLDYIYTSEIELDLECVQEVLAAATVLQVSTSCFSPCLPAASDPRVSPQLEKVIDFCCDFLFSWLDESNVVEVHRLADVYGLQQLNAKVHSYLLRNIQTFSRSEGYRMLPQDEVFRALSSNQLQVSSENQVYEAALHYHFSPEEVESDQVYLQEPLRMLDAVRFCLMDRHVLQRLHDRLSPCPLKAAVSAALRYHQQEMLQPVLQSPGTQPRSTLHCILGFGGRFSSNSYMNSENLFQVFHPSWGEWRMLPASQSPRMSNQGIAVLNNFAYLIGGDKNTNGCQAESRCWRYDPRHNSWCSIQPLQQQRADHCVCVLGDHIYAVGGRDYRSELDSVERYDPRTNTWEFVCPLKRQVYAHAGAALDGRIYIACGCRGLTYLKETYCFDPAANTWTACAEGPVERAWHAMAALNGRIYVIGGSNDELRYRRDVVTVACFHPDADSWSLVATLPGGHGEPGVAVLDHRIYVLGGRSHDRGNCMKYVHVYDADSDEWGSEVELKERVSGLAACVALMPPSVVAKARSWQQHSKALWEDVNIDNSEDSSED
ncbi:kelch-like protein 22 isoform X2 [Takifugu flavidus]|uniref:kelch-like protein 22 isoform X2 n=1 Tax=Takifugu flavidus TaxID=433684 RepID=UPI0025445FDF|nr:kelch-like protein 22 isoform X2 [Takifugu flavidus]